jgi:hypothetical protein
VQYFEKCKENSQYVVSQLFLLSYKVDQEHYLFQLANHLEMILYLSQSKRGNDWGYLEKEDLITYFDNILAIDIFNIREILKIHSIQFT